MNPPQPSAPAPTPAPAPLGTAASAVARAIDAALEVSVVGGFGSPGIRLRRRMFRWSPVPPLTGRRVLLTGATSGLGLAAAIQLHRLGADLTILGRDEQRTAAAADRIADASGRDHDIEVALADLTSLAQARAFVGSFAASHAGLDVLIHNAGALSAQHAVSDEGFEATYAAQVLSPHIITTGLLPLLAEAPSSRVITVSSGGMYTARLDPPHMQMDAEHYDGVTAYALAKRAQVVMTQQWARRFGHLAQFHCMHPGWADTPGVQQSLPTFRTITRPLLRTPDEGADTITWLAAVDPVPGPNGSFWLDRRPRGTVRLPRTAAPERDAAALWELVCQQSGAHPADPHAAPAAG